MARLRIGLLITCLWSALNGSSRAPAQIFDDFNRADSTDLGPNWIETSGDWRIEGQHLRANPATGAQSITWVGTPPGAEYWNTVGNLDIFMTQRSLSYIGLRLNISATDELYIKVQGQVAPYDRFSHIGFYHRVGNGYGGWTGGAGFQALPLTFASARIVTYFKQGDKDTIYVDFDTDFNGSPEFTMSSPGVLNIAAGLGKDIGINGYGNGDADNFWVPEPSSLALFAVCLLLPRRPR